MPDLTVTFSQEAAARFSAACNDRLLRKYIDETGDPNPLPQVFGAWCLKFLARRFTFHYEEQENPYNPDPFDGLSREE